MRVPVKPDHVYPVAYEGPSTRPCRYCLENAHQAVLLAEGQPDFNRSRWETYACESFLYSYTHTTEVCSNPVRL